MSSMPFRRAFLSAVLLLGSAMLASAALPKTDAPARSDSLAGQLLVATQDIGDPRFRHTVILIVKQDRQGTLGIVLNRPADERSWSSVMDAIGEKADDLGGTVRIFAGGPMEPWIGFVVHTSDYRRDATIDLGRLAVTSNAQILRDMAHGKGPQKSLLAFGYAGWGAGQLEAEIADGAWFTEPADPKLVFDVDPHKLWDEAVARRPVPL